MREYEKPLEALACALVQSLDEWSEGLEKAMERSQCSRSGLVNRLREASPKIDKPLLGYWLLGREQLLDDKRASRRVPTIQDTARILTSLRNVEERERRSLMMTAERIALHRAQLRRVKGYRWRQAAVTAVRASERFIDRGESAAAAQA